MSATPEAMRLAISNIAWETAEDAAVAARMLELGVTGVEIAPTKIWTRPLEVSDREIAAYRDSWNARGISIVALQALLFGREDLVIFGSEVARRDTAEYLSGVLKLAARLGAGPLVFGSPRNRARGSLTNEQADAIAVPFFRDLGAKARDLGVVLCVEPNPPQYKCDYIVTSDEGSKLVDAVASPGFGLHLDAAAMYLAAEEPSAQALTYGSRICHFHFSAPNLGHVTPGGPIDYAALAASLRTSGYDGWISIEMRPPAQGLEGVVETLEFVTGVLRTPPKSAAKPRLSGRKK